MSVHVEGRERRQVAHAQGKKDGLELSAAQPLTLHRAEPVGEDEDRLVDPSGERCCLRLLLANQGALVVVVRRVEQVGADPDRGHGHEQDEQSHVLRGQRGEHADEALLHEFASTGSVKVKVEPLPGSDSTQMRPPCSSTRLLDRASPRPVPSGRSPFVASACWNSSKMRSWSSAAIPGPVSGTAILHLAVSLRGGDVDASPLRGELDRVTEQVEDDLADAALVAFDQVDRGSSSSCSAPRSWSRAP